MDENTLGRAAEVLYAEAACLFERRWDDWLALFTEDAVWDGGALGRFVGREAIRKFFEGCSKVVPFAIHQVTNPIVEVEGDRATGRWYLWEPIVFASGDRAMWMAARYDDRYRRERATWLFEYVTVDLRMLSPYEEGFAKVRIAEIPR